ncbi:hypothetical protein OOZ19_14760, partial [Saccharopolyspora sp. NFXS83]|nr:hypothetical protein [Saccharopolyspora sp. NFXS83]
MSKYESTDLPDDLQKFFKITLGMEWPEGSEGGLNAIHDALEKYADKAEQTAQRMISAAADIDAALDGETAEATVNYVKNDLPGYLNEQVAVARDLASKARDAAADIQKNKIMFIAMTAMTLATVISLIASLFGAFMVPAVLAAARVGITALLRELIKQIAQNIVKQLARVPQAVKAGGWKAGLQAGGKQAWQLGKYPAGGAAFGAGVMGGLDAGIQGFQKDVLGNRDNINTESIKGMVIGGAIGGAASGFAAGAARGIAKSVDDVIGNFNKNIANANKLRPPSDQIPEKKLTRGQVAFGRFSDGVAQIVSVAASNPLVYIATDDKHGVASDGMFGAFARGGTSGGKAGGGGTSGGGSPTVSEVKGPGKLEIPGPDGKVDGKSSGDGSGDRKGGGEGTKSESSTTTTSEGPPTYAEATQGLPSYAEATGEGTANSGQGSQTSSGNQSSSSSGQSDSSGNQSSSSSGQSDSSGNQSSSSSGQSDSSGNQSSSSSG